ncbi:MAG: hypothetical protein EG822_03780 [Deltaproteobacteria bacterium]|nr:hypothetical protein [Deltaproteobacteria bacterium]TLN05072.1 MAG: hypothetical protein FDZ73_00080 [bacterium]
MTTFNPMRNLPGPAGYGQGDVLVLFGELFGRGYANGMVEEARRAGMTVIGITVGRRETDGSLRPLTEEELVESEKVLGGKIINIPLEAGFDMDRSESGIAPVDQLKGIKSDGWETAVLDWDAIEQSKKAGIERFSGNLAKVMDAINAMIPDGVNVLFSHTMAGGIPRARILMPVLNRVFKGQGERFTPSEVFWRTDLGKLCSACFDEVTANTFQHLIDFSRPIRERIESSGKKVAYTAYGYHGCEVLIGEEYTWQSYTPYLQGWAKMRLEEIATAAWEQGVRATVFNCPEIQTNSSALFLGVEISLYPLLKALRKEGGGASLERISAACSKLLKEGITIETLLSEADRYLAAALLKPFHEFSSWPHHNTPEQAALMLTSATSMLDMNKDSKNIVCAELSRAVFQAVGRLMNRTSWDSGAPVYWLNHDIVARELVAGE